MPYGLYLTVTHTGTTAAALLLNDIFPTTDGTTTYRRAGPVYVPVSGTITLTFTDTVATSFENGAIRGFVDLGYLTATLFFGTGVQFPPATGDVSGTYPNLTVVGLQGNDIDAAAPAAGEALVWNGVTSKWTPSPVAATGAAGGDLSGNYPNPTVDGLQTRPVDPTAPAINDALVWDGAKWTHLAVGAGATVAVYGSFSDTTDQAFVVGAPFVVKFDTTEAANGVSVVNDPISLRPTRLTVAQAGVYALTLSPQILHTGGGTEIITFWLRLNGSDVLRSASSLEMGNNNNRTLPYIEIILPMAAGQYVEWVFTASTGTNVTLENFDAVLSPPAAFAVPAIPSVIAGVKRLGS